MDKLLVRIECFDTHDSSGCVWNTAKGSNVDTGSSEHVQGDSVQILCNMRLVYNNWRMILSLCLISMSMSVLA